MTTFDKVSAFTVGSMTPGMLLSALKYEKVDIENSGRYIFQNGGRGRLEGVLEGDNSYISRPKPYFLRCLTIYVKN